MTDQVNKIPRDEVPEPDVLGADNLSASFKRFFTEHVGHPPYPGHVAPSRQAEFVGRVARANREKIELTVNQAPSDRRLSVLRWRKDRTHYVHPLCWWHPQRGYQ